MIKVRSAFGIETEAVLLVLKRIVEGKDRLLWSWVMSFENNQQWTTPIFLPKQQSRHDGLLWDEVSDGLQERASEIAQTGIPALDAAHLAAAEVGGADIVLTCDDIMIRRAERLGLALRVLNPVAYLKEVIGNG